MKLFSNRTWPSIYQRGLKTLGLNRQTQDRYDINYRFFESWTPESAYIFGFIAADGYLKVDNGYRNDTSLQFEIAEYDADILYKIKDALEYEGPVTHSSRGTVRLSIFNRKICKDLADKGIPIQDKTENMFWPETLPQELESHFVRGLFDGDGSIYQKQNSICVQFLGNESVLNSLKNSLPILSKRRVRKRNYGNIWDLQYSYRMAEAIIGWMYQDATIYLQRKYDKMTKISEPS
jgi:hypothetical protein